VICYDSVKIEINTHLQAYKKNFLNKLSFYCFDWKLVVYIYFSIFEFRSIISYNLICCLVN